MAPVKFSRVISVSSEDPRYPAKNLLSSDLIGPWKCKEAGEKQAVIILQLEESCTIQSVDIGNENSALIEILVGKSVAPDEFEILRVASVLMSVQDAKNDQNKNVVRFFKHDEFSKPAADQSWDRLKIICKQPFNKHVQYGLAFVKVHARNENDSTKKDKNVSFLGRFALKKDDNENEPLSVGSLFARRKDLSEELSAASAIRQASNSPSSSILGKISASTKRLSDALPKKDVKKARKNGDFSEDHSSNDCRRSITGRLMYLQDDPDEEAETSNAQTPKNTTPSTHTSQTNKNDRPAKPVDSASTQSKIKKTFSTTKNKPKKDDPKTKPSKDPSSKKRLTMESDSPSQKKIATKQISVKKKPFNKLLEGVVFVISGYQNPFRSELRSKALKMGAKYKGDWDASCTHLICAFTNTPKYNQVLGQGWIIRKDWIEDCYQQRKRLSCISYRLDKNDSYTNSNDEEIWEGDENTQPIGITSKESENSQSFDLSDDNEVIVSQQSISQIDVYDAETDVDSEHEDPQIENKYENISLKVLPALFENIKFYLGTDLFQSTVHKLQRYIIAYKGEPHDDVDNVTYIISEDIKYKDNVSGTPVLLPDWIWECNDQKKLIPVDNYLL